MIIVKNNEELQALDRNDLKKVVLGGDLTNSFLMSEKSNQDTGYFIRQTPLKMIGNTVQAEIANDAVNYLKDRKIKAVVLAEYVYLRAMKSHIRSKKRCTAYFVSDPDGANNCHITMFQVADGKIARIQKRRFIKCGNPYLNDKLDEIIESDLNGDWQASEVIVFASGHEHLVEWQENNTRNIELKNQNLFSIGKFTLKEVVLSKHFQVRSTRKTVKATFTCIAAMVLTFGLALGWISWKESALETQREKYRVTSERQKLSFETSDLVLWSKREEYLTTLYERQALSSRIEKILKALSSLGSGYKVVVTQISTGRDSDFRANGKYYDTKLEVGFERTSTNAEKDVSDALNLLIEQLGNSVEGVDVWNKIRLKTFNGTRFNMVILYANTKEER